MEVVVTYKDDEDLISNPKAFIRSKLQTSAGCPENPNAANDLFGETRIWVQNHCAISYITANISPGHVIDSNIRNGSHLIIGDTLYFTNPEHTRPASKSYNRLERRSSRGSGLSTELQQLTIFRQE
jgi:hypothetical protein